MKRGAGGAFDSCHCIFLTGFPIFPTLRYAREVYLYHTRLCARSVRPAECARDENDTKNTIIMANEETLGPRKTMFVLVIVVGCFAVLWPRILSPLVLGQSKDQLKPNQFDRDAGCCEVIFETEVAVLELVNEVCNSAIGDDGKLSPYAASECRKAVNETCGFDIAAFLKRSENVGKTTKMLLETMKNSNSSCLKEHFGVPVWSLSTHQALNSWTQQDTIKQERPPVRGAGPHPALRERGRAIPAGAPTPPSRGPVPLPPHARVRTSPLSVYFELDIKPPPIPGMRPPLGSPGGPVPAPKSSMGFVMPIYTICIIVFFVYTLSKLLFKRTGSIPYEPVSPDPQFRRRVFRDDSRSSPETKLVVTAISGLVAEVQQQMDAGHVQNQQRQDVQDNHTRPYTNGTVLGNNAPQIVTDEYTEPSKDKEPSPEMKAPTPGPKEPIPELEEPTDEKVDEDANVDLIKLTENVGVEEKEDTLIKAMEDFMNDASEKRDVLKVVSTPELESSTAELLEEALKEDSPAKEDEQESGSVKVVNMEMTAHAADGGAWPSAERPPAPSPRPTSHEAEDVKSIFLETEIPQQSRVLVAEFAEDRADRPAPTKHSPLVVSGKMTLSLIQDAPRDTPDRDLESTIDEFTTASAVTQPAAEKQDDLSEEDIEEEIEVEEIEEEVEEEEEEEEIPNNKVAEQNQTQIKKEPDTESESMAEENRGQNEVQKEKEQEIDEKFDHESKIEVDNGQASRDLIDKEQSNAVAETVTELNLQKETEEVEELISRDFDDDKITEIESKLNENVAVNKTLPEDSNEEKESEIETSNQNEQENIQTNNPNEEKQRIDGDTKSDEVNLEEDISEESEVESDNEVKIASPNKEDLKKPEKKKGKTQESSEEEEEE